MLLFILEFHGVEGESRKRGATDSQRKGGNQIVAIQASSHMWQCPQSTPYPLGASLMEPSSVDIFFGVMLNKWFMSRPDASGQP